MGLADFFGGCFNAAHIRSVLKGHGQGDERKGNESSEPRLRAVRSAEPRGILGCGITISPMGNISIRIGIRVRVGEVFEECSIIDGAIMYRVTGKLEWVFMLCPRLTWSRGCKVQNAVASYNTEKTRGRLVREKIQTPAVNDVIFLDLECYCAIDQREYSVLVQDC